MPRMRFSLGNEALNFFEQYLSSHRTHRWLPLTGPCDAFPVISDSAALACSTKGGGPAFLVHRHLRWFGEAPSGKSRWRPATFALMTTCDASNPVSRMSAPQTLSGTRAVYEMPAETVWANQRTQSPLLRAISHNRRHDMTVISTTARMMPTYF